MLAELAGRRLGLVTRREALHAGVSAGELRARVGRGALLRVHPSVYRVGHRAPSLESSYLAAVLACGDGALLSGRAVAHLLGLTEGRPPRPEVTAVTERRVRGVVTHRARRQENALDASVWRGVPVTSVPRTLVDLAGKLPGGPLARACHEAIVRHRLQPVQVEALLRRRPSSRGAERLRQVLVGDERVLLSKLEAGFLAMLRAAGLPLPETNRRAGTHWVDCRWPDRRLTVELDSYRFHSSRRAWEQDRRREREARARGDDFRRFVYADVFETPALTVAEPRSRLRCPALVS